jgi:hypothetical protein
MVAMLRETYAFVCKAEYAYYRLRTGPSQFLPFYFVFLPRDNYSTEKGVHVVYANAKIGKLWGDKIR